ncbi:MAG: hypothetical protein RIS18_954 [Actinomycetota bacterium]|jgi:hypothetical protein
MNSDSRQFLPPLSELIDRLTVTQIKLNLIPGNSEDFNSEVKKLINDINLIAKEKKIEITGELVQAIVMISQINLHIWRNKDLMQENIENESQYLSYLKKAHQMNGVRNLLKNYILKLEGISDTSQLRSNFEMDGLEWKLNLE